VQELVDASHLPQASVYRKLKDLQEHGLVGIQRSGLAPDGHRADLYRSLLAETLVRLRGSRLDVFAAFRDLASERLSEMWDAVRAEAKR
jgi:hypothetical protein